MSGKNIFEISKRCNWTDKDKKKIDDFILQRYTNGEFINSLRFLEYHPAERFQDDSIMIVDSRSKTIRAVMMAAKKSGCENTIVSHPGTTFAGPVIDRRLHIETIELILNLLLDYYESKYDKVELKLTPEYYSYQSCNTIGYFLLKRGYQYGMTGLANMINISGLETEEDVLEMFTSKRRNQVRKVLKENNFKFYENSEIESAVWETMNQNIKEKFGSGTTHTLEEIWELQCRCKENIKPYYIKKENGEYGAFGLAFLYKNVFHTQYLDLNYLYSREYPNLLLILKLIMKARDLGYQYFSFGASTEKNGEILNYGLYNYKAEYGGGDIILPLYSKNVKE